MAFWPHRIDEEGPGSGGGKPVPAMEQLRHALQHRLELVLAPVAAVLHRLGASANQVSVAGFVLNVGAAALVVAGHLVPAGALYLFAGLLDLLDGVLARTGGNPTRFGAFLDSTLDRASEGVVFTAIGYRFAAEGSAVDAGIVVLALLGSFLVSYVRARAEGLGVQCRVGDRDAGGAGGPRRAGPPVRTAPGSHPTGGHPDHDHGGTARRLRLARASGRRLTRGGRRCPRPPSPVGPGGRDRVNSAGPRTGSFRRNHRPHEGAPVQAVRPARVARARGHPAAGARRGPGPPPGARVRGQLPRPPPHREQVPGPPHPAVLAGSGGRGRRRRGRAQGQIRGRERGPRGRSGDRDDRLARVPGGDAGGRGALRPAPRLDGLRDRSRLHP